MGGPSPRDRFADCITGVRIDLAEAALLIAAEEYPSLDVAGYLSSLDDLAARGRENLEGAGDTVEQVERLNRYLFVERGFAGNREHYEDPRNSFINEVIDRRSGIPITLALVYMEVARRLGLDFEGICFPGHFLIKCGDGDGEIVVDPFSGVVLSPRECQERLTAVLGEGVVLDHEVHLRAADPREILVRMLTNLKLLYVRSGDFDRALSCCDRILLLIPDAPHELRDRGLVFEQLECFGAAAADLERFLALAPRDPSAAPLRARLPALRERAGRLH